MNSIEFVEINQKQNHNLIVSNSCRTCASVFIDESDLLSVYTNVKITNANDNSVENFCIKNELVFSEIEIHNNDGLPQRICQKCIEKVVQCHTFRIQCKIAENILKSYKLDESNLKKENIYEFPVGFEENNDANNIQKEIEDTESAIHNKNNLNIEHSVKSKCKDFLTEENIFVPVESLDDEIFKNEQDNYYSSTLQEQNDLKFSTINLSKVKKHRIIKVKENDKKCFVKVTRLKINDIDNGNEPLKHEVTRCIKCSKFCHSVNIKFHQGTCKDYDANYSSIFKCMYCRRQSKDMKTLENHIIKMHSKFPISCNMCQKTFSDAIMHNEHIFSHLDNKEEEKVVIYRCDKCNKIFNSQSGKWKHTYLCHLKKLFQFKCEKCPKKFKESYMYNNHMKLHDSQNQQFQCKICEKAFLSQLHLNRHKLIHTKSHMCDICNINCNTIISKWKHYNMHHPEIQCYLKCEICAKKFEDITLYQKHIKSHDLKKQYFKCSICEKSFKLRHHLKLHEVIHTTAKKINRYGCTICNQSFTTASARYKHKTVYHSNLSLECKICNKTFSHAFAYKYHIKSHDPNKKYKCNYCEKSFLAGHHLACHERTHTGERPYKCEECNKTWKDNLLFKIHLEKYHPNNVDLHLCEICGAGFAFEFRLKHHKIKAHTGEFPYKCELCDKKFCTGSQLNVHKKIAHSENKKKSYSYVKKPKTENINKQKFGCTICPKSFHALSSLNFHLMKHRDDINKFVCEICKLSYKKPAHLSRHRRLKHSELSQNENKTFMDNTIDKKQIEKKFKCDKCYKRFVTLKGMEQHAENHSQDQPCKCPVCGKIFSSYYLLRRHDSAKHLNNYTNAAIETVYAQNADILYDQNVEIIDNLNVEIVDAQDIEILNDDQNDSISF